MAELTQIAEQMPSSIGRYQVQQCVGYGAMGAVYKAFDPVIKRTLAIKTIRLDIPRSAPQYKSFIERFYHEAHISGTLSHPNIVTLFDVSEEGGLPFLAMEFVAGETIAAIIESGVRFNPERVIGLVSQIASAIDYAHSKGVVHRDIKPSNLILAEGDQVKVTDFGIAKLADTEMTQSGVLLGTPSYMSPEQAMGEQLDGRSDLFSLGVCAFEMLSGEQPFPGNNVTSILYKLVHVDPIEPASLEMSGLIPQKWREVFGKVLAKKPDDRYQTAAEFVHDLEFCLGSWFGAAMGDETIQAAPTEAETVAAPSVTPAQKAAAAARAETGDEGATTVLTLPAAPPPEPVSAPTSPAAEPEAEAEGQTILLTGRRGAPAPVQQAAPPPEEAPRLDSASVPTPAPLAVSAPSSAGAPSAPSADGGDLATTVLIKTPAVPAARAPETATAVTKRNVLPVTRPVVRGRGVTPPPPATVAAPRSGPGVARINSRPAPRRRGVPLALLLGGAAVFVLLASVAGVVAVARWRQAAQPQPTPAATSDDTHQGATPAAATEGMLRIETRPLGAEVALNGEPRGVTPFEARLPLGLYDVQVTLKDHEPQARTVDLTATKPQADLSLTLAVVQRAPTSGVGDITSTPPGASVELDGVALGVTPLRGVDLAPGERRLVFRKAGYADTSRSIVAHAGKRVTIDVALAVIVVATPVRATPAPVVVDANRVYLDREVDTPPKRLSGDSPDPAGVLRMKRGERVSVTVTFVVAESGEVRDVQISESQGGERLDQVVVEAVKRWRFAPATKAGTPVKVRETRKFTYQAG